MTTCTPSEIASECAGFAHDNYDPDDSDGFNASLTADASWSGWHCKEGLETPEMPFGWALEYWRACEMQGGADFKADIQGIDAR